MVRAKKSFGQHFLHDANVIDKILLAAQPEDFLWVVEVGPGTGALTRQIVARRGDKGLVLVEADADLLVDLTESFPGAEIVQGDAAKVDYDALSIQAPWLFVSNLPYNAATAILMRVLSSARPPARLVVMVQKEVGERMLGLPGAMSVLTVAVQTYAGVEKLCLVKPGSFSPPPAVDSMVLILTPHVEAQSALEPEKIIALAKAGFANRRKYLSGNLAKAGMARAEDVRTWLQEQNFSPLARAEELTVADWIALAERVARSA